MKRFLYFLIIGFIFFKTVTANAQVKNDSGAAQTDTVATKIQPRATPRDTLKKPARDTHKIVRPPVATLPKDSFKNKIDTVRAIKQPAKSLSTDSVAVAANDTASAPVATNEKIQLNVEKQLLARNKFINIKDAPAYFIEEVKNTKGKEFLFYALCLVVLVLGLFRTFYHHYFNNLFRVFFNTSLRQTQLTDQLMQARLPSFILNIFFTLSAGVYIWLLFMHFHPPRLINSRLLLPFCIICVGVIYFIKYCILKFIGWVSGIREATDNYIFVIFLINKITGILLVPVIIVLAFSMPQWIKPVTTVSLLVLVLFFLSRYVKSYAVIERKLPLNPFHFFIYILGAEIVPLMIIYKIAIDYVV